MHMELENAAVWMVRFTRKENTANSMINCNLFRINLPFLSLPYLTPHPVVSFFPFTFVIGRFHLLQTPIRRHKIFSPRKEILKNFWIWKMMNNSNLRFSHSSYIFPIRSFLLPVVLSPSLWEHQVIFFNFIKGNAGTNKRV